MKQAAHAAPARLGSAAPDFGHHRVMARTHTLPFLLVACVVTTFSFAQDSASAPSAIDRTGQALDRTAHRAGAAIERGAERTGAAIGRGAQRTAAAVQRGVHRTGEAIGRGARRTGRAIDRGAEKVGIKGSSRD